MRFNMSLDTTQAVEACYAAVRTGNYQLVTSVLKSFTPDEAQVRTFIAQAIIDGDIRTVQAVAKSHHHYCRYYKGIILTMWVVAGNCVVASQWKQLMTFVSDNDLLTAQAIVASRADTELTGVQDLMLDRLGVPEPGTYPADLVEE